MDDPKDHDGLVRESFGPKARAYLLSETHARGEDLDLMEVLFAARPGAEVLDLGCGGGHVSYLAARHAASVTAYDLSPSMLEVVEAAAARRGLHAVRTKQGAVESLPFADASFDVVASRYSAHHWRDVGLAVREAARVLKKDGLFVLVDVVSPGRPVLDTHLQAVEVLRDISHVRDYSPAEWLDFAAQGPLRTIRQRMLRLRLEFTSWVTRMNTPEPMRLAIRELQRAASREVAEHFNLEADGTFSVDIMLLHAEK